MKYRLGLDVGTNSLGWAVLGLDDKDTPREIVDSGVRIFADSRVDKSEATLKATRGEKRSARRRRDRFKQRQKYLLAGLEEHGLFPKDLSEEKNLKDLNPLELCSDALKKELSPHKLSHFCNRMA